LSNTQHPKPTVSIILPCFNEEGFILTSVGSLLSQETDGHTIEVIVVDGMSTDATIEKLQTVEDPRLVLLHNPEKTVPYAMRYGLEQAQGEFIFRADAHAKYPDHYVSRLLRHLEEPGLIAVGGALRTVAGGDGPTSQAIAMAMNSRFGVGTSFRTLAGDEPREVGTVPFGGWRRETVAAVGGFDTDFTRAQDLEFNVRLRKSGGRIICDPSVVVTYYSRPAFKNLAGMSYQYGYWKVLVNAKHKVLSSFRQLFPAAMVLSICVGLLAMPFLGNLWQLGLAPAALYLGSALLMSLISSIRNRRFPLAPRLFASFLTAHLVYGFGYLRALFDTYILRKPLRSQASRVTR
jgi:glycosyltransferase involved in cell wall biosynthesis